EVAEPHGVALGDHQSGGVHQVRVGERRLFAAVGGDGHARGDGVVLALVQPGDQCVPLDVLPLDVVDAQIAVDLAVQGDGGASEFAVFGLPAVGALACEGDGDRALVLQLRQEVVLPTVSAVIAAICGSAGRQARAVAPAVAVIATVRRNFFTMLVPSIGRGLAGVLPEVRRLCPPVPDGGAAQ